MAFLPITSRRAFALLMAAAIFLIGTGYIALLPPFEGMDETAHYSSIRQIAEGGGIPVLGHSFIDNEVIDYRNRAPSPYRLPISHTTRSPSYGKDIISYAAFFASPDLQKNFIRHYRTAMPHANYVPETEEFNWEAQHPPLYYLLMAPVMKATDLLPFVTQFFILRFASFALAFAGFLIAAHATYRYMSDKNLPKNIALAAFLFYPVIAPMFFVEFARIGNDSLCLLLMGLLWWMILAWLKDEPKLIYAAGIGLCFALGLLTKALFIPLLAGFALFMMFRISSCSGKKKKNYLRALGVMLGSALIAGGWWYALRYIQTGTLTGSLDSITLQKQGGLINNLVKNFSVAVFLENILQIFRSWSWSGSASSVFVWPVLQAPIFLLALAMFIGYFHEIKNKPLASIAWLSAWFVVPFLAGLIWHTLNSIASQTNITPGWYLHVAAPAFALAMAYGLQNMAANKEKRLFLAFAIFYAVVFLAIVLWSQASLFAGCAVPGPDKTYRFTDPVFCFGRLHDVIANLSVLGRPYIAATAFAGGFSCLFASLCMIRKLPKHEY